MGFFMNIENNRFMAEIFVFFDKDEDGLVDFDEFIRGLDIAERGNFQEKVAYCMEVYDLYALQSLDIFTLRHLLKKSYSEVIINLEKVTLRFQSIGMGAKLSWEQFSQEFLPTLSTYLPTALDRMELHKNLVNQLEFKYGFTLESLE